MTSSFVVESLGPLFCLAQLAYTQNNHIEIILIELLPSPLSLYTNHFPGALCCLAENLNHVLISWKIILGLSITICTYFLFWIEWCFMAVSTGQEVESDYKCLSMSFPYKKITQKNSRDAIELKYLYCCYISNSSSSNITETVRRTRLSGLTINKSFCSFLSLSYFHSHVHWPLYDHFQVLSCSSVMN